jgi:hypothetical protein
MTWLEALKYGPITIAALTAAWTAGLLTIELNRPSVRRSAQRLISVFMVFCFLLTIVSYGVTAVENWYTRQDRERAAAEIARQSDESISRLGEIRTLVARLDSQTVSKISQLDNTGSRALVRSICETITQIYEITGGVQLRGTCAQEMGLAGPR